jgi:RNA 2',3'-cyclic 3'-phosphodiesterase
MARLFIAIEFSDEIKSALQQFQPPSLPGVRNTQREQLHLTLHFLGESCIEAVSAALQSVRLSPFSLTIEGVGRFETQGNGSILWAGVQPNPELTTLHRSIASALHPTGFRPETGPYTPHITLARCEPAVPVEAINTFLKVHANLSVPAVMITQISLYSSVLTSAGPVYKLEAQASGL